ncbi:formiminotetrahydrofolate cyclodeaminase [Halalkaliarchaeum desulfuricum]|uniref:Formiminotetrahydrofolate cyclodeaminase n=1 Tax=Halalkaliarchaeum desulfuricum TaxID=2055893 RepID=A0A343TLN2_9EURY|nr:cyclodeaminase/cyclohydrolase family protein [Halalkaliarchaeum desulfuricum]AUX10004.1 formiminotetrahydrofolate cyclodeaminase [Halalkaliarchaeum desulfuricum]
MTYAEQTISEFLGSVASDRVTPAGGTAAAVSGAIGAALCEMVCIHTIAAGTGGDSTAETDACDNTQSFATVRDELRGQRRCLLALADADASAVDEFLSSNDVERPPERSSQATTEQKRAIGVPLAIADTSLAVLENAAVVIAPGNRNALADGVTGAYLARGALQSALYIVWTNADQLEDPEFLGKITGRASEIEASAERAFDRIEGVS